MSITIVGGNVVLMVPVAWLIVSVVAWAVLIVLFGSMVVKSVFRHR